MSIVNDKKGIINEISVLSSIGKNVDIPDQNYTLPSINNKNEPIPFMLDILTSLIGSEALERTTGEVITNFVRKVEPDLKDSLKTQSITYNSDENLPSGFTQGYEIPVKQIDLFGKLKTDPASEAGQLAYGSTVNTFDKSVYNAIATAGSDVTYNNITLNYDETNDTITVKPTSVTTIGGFVDSFIDGLKIIDEKEFVTLVLDTIYGTIAKNTNKPLPDLIEEEKFRTLVGKIENDEEVTITNDDLIGIQKNASDKLRGVVPVDVGCSIIDSILLLSDINNLITGNTGTTDSLTIGNNFANVMNNSFGRVVGQTNPTNKNAIRDGFFKKLLKAISNSLIFALTATPQVRLLMIMIKGFKNNSDISVPTLLSDDIKNQKNFISCISKSVGSLLNEFIFNLVKTELLKLIVPVTTLIIREKLQNFIRIIQNLII